MANLCPFKKANLPFFYMVGGPACGKNTQAEKIRQKFGYTVVNMGKLLREEMKSGSCRSAKIREALQIGDIAPQEITLDILKEALVKAVCVGKPILIVGFPRNSCQKKALEKEIGEPKATIFIDVTDCTMRKRQQTRGSCSDRPDIINRRMDVFQQQTKPMIDDMINGGKVIKIDGEGQPDTVFCELSKAVECQNTALASSKRDSLLNGNTDNGNINPTGGKCGDPDCECQPTATSKPCSDQPKPRPCGGRCGQNRSATRRPSCDP